MSFDLKEQKNQIIADKSTEVKKDKNKKEFISPNENNQQNNSAISIEKDNLDSKENQKELKFLQLSEYYMKNISEELISKYGNYYLSSFDQKKLKIPPEGFMSKHKINLKIRTKMVDWMLEVFHTLNSNELTIFAAVNIMDQYFWKCKDILKSEDVHLIGVVCIYLASKTYDLLPIPINNLIHSVAHDMFTQKTIKETEKKIVKAIDFEVMIPTTYEFIQFLLYDFYINNKSTIDELNIKPKLGIFENCAIWLAKMCNHFEKYSSVPPTYLSLGCVLIAFDMMKDSCETFNEDMQKFFKDWLQFLINKIGKTPEIKSTIQNIYISIEASYREFRQMNLGNLVKHHELYFD